MLISHSSIYFIGRGLPALANLLGIFVFTRILEPSEFGRYALILASVGVVNAIIFQWLSLSILRFVPAYKEKENELFSTVAILYFVVVIVTGFLTFSAYHLKLHEIASPFQISIGLILLWAQAFFIINQEIGHSNLSPVKYSILGVLKTFLSLIFGIIFVKNNMGGEGIVLGMILGMVITNSLFFPKEFFKIRFKLFNFDIFKELIRYGLPFSLTFAMSYILNSSDRIMIGMFLSVEDTGIYAVGYDISQQTITMLMMCVNLAAYPIALHAYENEGIQSAISQLKKNAILLLSISVPATMGFIAISSNISHVFLGQGFNSTAYSVMPLIAIGAFFSGLRAFYYDLGFQISKNTMLQVKVVFFASIFNLCFNFLLIPKMGINGAAFSTLLSFLLALGLSMYMVKRVFPMPFPTKQFIKIVISSLCMVIILIPIKDKHGLPELFLQIICGLTVYVLFYAFLNISIIRNNINPNNILDLKYLYKILKGV